MPAILPVVIIGAAAAIGGTTALVIGTIVAVGVSLALSQNMSGVASTPNPTGTTYKTNPMTLTFSSDAPRRMVYGKSRISGVVSYANVAGDGHEYLYMVVVIAAHQITNITEIYFDGKRGADVADGYFDYWWYDGTQTTADATLVSTFSEYTSKCVLKGCAYAVVRLNYDKSVWSTGRPDIQFDVQGKPVLDPRDNVTRWCNNGALVIADYMTSEDGLGATDAEIDWESVRAAADICDQIPNSMASSLCDGRYTIDGVVELSTKNGDTISQMLAACAGTVVWTEGVYRIYVGAARTAVTREITSEDLRGNPSLQPRTPSDQSFNSVKGTFVDSTAGWVFSDFPPVVGDEYVTQDGGVRQFKDIVLNFTTSPITAQRLATIFLRRSRLEKRITLPCKWTVFNYEVWDVVKLNLPQLGWVSKEFQITDWKMTPPTHEDAGGVELTLVEYSDAIYSDDMTLKPIQGGGVIVTPDVTIPKPLTALYATSNLGSVNPTTGKPRIRFDWSESTDIYCVGYEIAFGKVPFQPQEDDYTYVAGRRTTSMFTPDLVAGDTYVGYIRVVNSYENRSTSEQSDTVIVKGAESQYPERVQGFTATVVDDTYVDLVWSSPVGAAASTIIAWSPTTDFDDAVLVAVQDLPQTSIRVDRETSDGHYFAMFQSAAGLAGLAATVPATGRIPTNVALEVELSKYTGELTNAIWYKADHAVVQSKRLASELGWEVFDMMVPEPYDNAEYWSTTRAYVGEGVRLVTSGRLGWTKAPYVPSALTPVNAQAQLRHWAWTEEQQGDFVTTESAWVHLGFKVTHDDPNGVQFNNFYAKLEKP